VVMCKGKEEDRGTFCNSSYMSQTCFQKHFTYLEVAADGHELMIPWHIMWPFIAHSNEQLDPWCS